MLLFADATTWASELPYVALAVGLVMLVLGAELLVRGAVWIALNVGMSRMAVGLTLVSIGTSLPELLVTLTAADKEPDIAMANVLGSNVANVLLIIGVTATIRAIHISTRWFELAYMLVLGALACVPFFLEGCLDRWLAGIMLAVLVIFLGQLLARERRDRKLMQEEQPPAPSAMGWLWNCLLLAGGFTMLAYGAEWLVDGAIQVAENLEMSKGVIGLTIVAIGTSLPELATSAVAALRGQSEICIGNVIGSNIFNIGAVLGGAGLIRPFAFKTDDLTLTIVVATASAVLLTIVLRKLKGVPRPVGLLFLLSYAAFMTYMVSVYKPEVG